MSKPKVTIKPVDEKELLADIGPKAMARMEKDIENIKFASKHHMETFGGTYASSPLPLHLLSRKLSKQDEWNVHQFVAMVLNAKMEEYAQTIRYVYNMPKDDKDVLRIMKNTKYAIKMGKKYKDGLNKLWKRTKKLKKGELFLIGLKL